MPTTSIPEQPSLPEQLSRTGQFTRGAPDRFTVARDGATALFLRSRSGDDPANLLWALDVADGTERLLADPGTGIAGYATDAAGALAAFTADGHLWTVRVADSATLRLPAAHPASDPRPDPTGRRIAYVHAGALRVIDADGGGDRELAAPDGPDVTFGVADLGSAELDGAGGFWWSPDGERLLVKRVDTAQVQLWYIADPSDPAKPPRATRYPAAGTANADVTLWLVDLDGGRTEAAWDRRAFEYAPRAGWSASGPYIQVGSRDQHTARLLGVDPADGTTRVLHEQRDACWVQTVPGLPTWTDGGAVVAHADVAGTRHLTVDGEPVTPPGLQLRAVLDVDGDSDNEVLFVAAREPTEAHLWSYAPARGLQPLSAEPGVHSGTRRGGTLVHIARGPDIAGSRVSVRRDGADAVAITSHAEHPGLDLRATQLVLGPRELRAALYLPSWHRPGDGPLPVLMDPYGGAGAQRVTAERTPAAFVAQWFAEHGFAVLVADGSGTPGRGPAWEREVYGDIYGPVIDDQVAALHEAARRHPELDLGRVSIRGWSFGGSLALAAVLRRPDVFHAAVAGAGPTDQRLYNAPWRERFLGHPDAFPERYEACSVLHEAPNLSRPLLLIHGLADENVFPVHTLRMSEALLAAGRTHEVLLLPGVGHRALAAPSGPAMLRHQLAFLRRHLGEPKTGQPRNRATVPANAAASSSQG